MQGLELLVIGHEYKVTTQFNTEGFDHLVFTGFAQENEGVTLACFEDVQRGYESFFDTSIPTNQVIVSTEESIVYLNLPTPDIAANYKKIKSLATKYNMILDWDRIKRQDNKELENILAMIERTYATR